MPKDPRDISARARQDAKDLAIDDASSVSAPVPSDDAGMEAALSEFAGDTRIPVVALVTVAEILTRIYGPAPSGGGGESPPEPA